MQIWELATGKLKLTLTGHIEQVRGETPNGRQGWEGMGRGWGGVDGEARIDVFMKEGDDVVRGGDDVIQVWR